MSDLLPDPQLGHGDPTADPLTGHHAGTDESDLPKRKGWGIGFWLSVVWMVLVLILTILAPLLPFVDKPRHLPRLLGRTRLPARRAAHWFGVNDNGDDLFSQVVNGGRISLFISFTVVILGFITGGMVGMIAGYFRGRIDRVISAVVDILLAFPALVLALAMIAIFASDGNVVRPNLPGGHRVAVDPVGRPAGPDHPRHHPRVLRARVRHRGPDAGRQELPHHPTRDPAQRHPADGGVQPHGHRRGHRRRGRPRLPRTVRRRPCTHLGQAHQLRVARSSRAADTSRSSRPA